MLFHSELGDGRLDSQRSAGDEENGNFYFSFDRKMPLLPILSTSFQLKVGENRNNFQVLNEVKVLGKYYDT
jgi:hypothetical protein